MYKPLSKDVIDEMDKIGFITLSFNNEWILLENWTSTPSHIVYIIPGSKERIFSCYHSLSRDTMQITNLEPTGVISHDKALIDAYMWLTIKGLVDMAKVSHANRLIVDSYEPSAGDHMLDMGFKVTHKIASLPKGARGLKILTGGKDGNS